MSTPTLREIAERIARAETCGGAGRCQASGPLCEDCAELADAIEAFGRQMQQAEHARSEADMRCETCVHFLPWRREGAKTPLDSILGDCQHPKFMGHITAVPKTFGCRFYWRRIIQTAIEAEEQP